MYKMSRRHVLRTIFSLAISVSLLAACVGDAGETSVSSEPLESTEETTISTTEAETEPSIEETEPSIPDDVGLKAAELVLDDYLAYSAESTSWWYRRTDTLFTENRDTIDLGVAQKVDPFQAIYQDPSEEKRLYLTFDAGYEHKNNTALILDVLQEKGVHAAFFITGAYMDSSPDVVKRMITDGHLVANHTLHHKDPVATLAEEGILAMAMDVEANADKFLELTDTVMPKLIRPGQGMYSEQVLAIYADMGYRAVFWDFAYRDWFVDDQPDPAAALEQVTGELHPGSVILLHAVSDTNVAILGDVIDFARDNGYSFHSLSDFPRLPD